MVSLSAHIKLLRCCALRVDSFCGVAGSLMAVPQWFRDLFPTLVVVVHLLPDENDDSMVVGVSVLQVQGFMAAQRWLNAAVAVVTGGC
ncbi:hypothetical protein DEO72_LG8g1933 [Vigna unguiculata]|uniref:Uncharacterized protein n=1 Tax=Vigna unguiculata TaxID=3917 RepID=A0A4D6MR49_VIGUN|nr:hypothetical protein DEO72_LG8g1933 [Vigna unguiculata]